VKIPLTASGGRPPYTFSFAPGSSLTGLRVQNGQPLPSNFTSSQTAGLLGVAVTAGAPSFTLRVTDANGTTADQTASLTITAVGPGMIPNLPYATNGQNYSQQLYASAARRGTRGNERVAARGHDARRHRFAARAPGTGVGNNFNVPVKATDANNSTGYFNYTLSVQAIQINWPNKPAQLPLGTVGVSYSHTLSASFGTSPYTWTVNSGSLPGGLTLSSGGVISGTPTAYSNSNVQFKVTDSASTRRSSGYRLPWCRRLPCLRRSPIPASALYGGHL